METATTSPRLLRLPEVCKRTGLGRSSLYDRMKSGSFPQPVPLTPTARAWIESEVDSWIAARVAERDGKAA